MKTVVRSGTIRYLNPAQLRKGSVLIKSFAEFNTELLSESEEQKRDWIINQVENTDRAHDEIKAEFIKKYGKQNTKFFDSVVHEIVD